MINVVEMPDGIALSNASLEKIKKITVKASKVITVENLTTYHDSDEGDSYIFILVDIIIIQSRFFLKRYMWIIKTVHTSTREIWMFMDF